MDKTRGQGFTLIELLLVIGLVTLLAAFLMPEFTSFNRRQILKDATVTLADALKQTQNLALGGVQTGSDFVARYRLKFTQEIDDPPEYYRGYQIERLDQAETLIEPVLQTKIVACAMCINSTTDNFTFLVPSGVTATLPNNPTSFLVCYPETGEQSISVEQSGRVQVGSFQASSCTCPFGC